MSMYPTKSVSGSSMWTPQARGDTSKIWKGGFSHAGGSKSTGSFSQKNPGNNEQRNSKKSSGCAFCG